MTVREINGETVERRRERLRDEYDDVTVREETETVGGDLFEELCAESLDGYTGGGYAWVVREPDDAVPLTESMPDEVGDERSVLMILGRGGTEWGLPGGGREDGETYERAAVREVHEETGVDCDITECFLVVHRVTVSEDDHDDRLHTLWVFFDAVYAGGSISIQPGELNGAAWFERPPDRLYPENEFRAADFWEGFEREDDVLARRL
ncbi:NUDIX domain-containing protein [Halomicrobium sp. IBSBa]|uniref:NUDIX hydrolase n=1 Tax=Halomicrobium sp. IBSBa TaxID=2778916 RepID=UPI001ABFFAFE|nr:NUDIX domain-containing protein [Halomicrobium sp. IBSBa]MBO4246702.1 NUDIX domain-containing protein [Halomicrobium sp. IBSBa]